MTGFGRHLLILAVLGITLLTALPCMAELPNWLPHNINSGYGERVDNLYWGIYYIVAFFFFLTEGILLYCMIAFRARPGKPAKYLHGSNVAEMIWTVIPALILIGIGVAQAGTWSDIRMEFPKEKDPNTLVVQVYPKQYAWEFRYTGVDGKFGTADDIYTTSLHVPTGKKILVKLTSSDVIHSFFIPHARVKLDAMPGILGRLWFEIDTYALWNLKENKIEYKKAADIKDMTIGFSQISGFPFKSCGWTYQLAADDPPDADEKGLLKKGHRTVKYSPFGTKATVLALKGGALGDVEFSSVTHVFHRFDIACAELCGKEHYLMKSTLLVDTPEVFDAWYKAQCDKVAKEGSPEALAKRWRKYWDLKHPSWNRVIE